MGLGLHHFGIYIMIHFTDSAALVPRLRNNVNVCCIDLTIFEYVRKCLKCKSGAAVFVKKKKREK